eukprot:1140137-Pelagomonas_calceolata.AAC.2
MCASDLLQSALTLPANCNCLLVMQMTQEEHMQKYAGINTRQCALSELTAHTGCLLVSEYYHLGLRGQTRGHKDLGETTALQASRVCHGKSPQVGYAASLTREGRKLLRGRQQIGREWREKARPIVLLTPTLAQQPVTSLTRSARSWLLGGGQDACPLQLQQKGLPIAGSKGSSVRITAPLAQLAAER